MTSNHRSQAILRDIQAPLTEKKTDVVVWGLVIILSFLLGVILALS